MADPAHFLIMILGKIDKIDNVTSPPINMSAWAKRRMTRRNFCTLVTQSMPAMVSSRKQVRVTLPDVKVFT